MANLLAAVGLTVLFVITNMSLVGLVVHCDDPGFIWLFNAPLGNCLLPRMSFSRSRKRWHDEVLRSVAVIWQA